MSYNLGDYVELKGKRKGYIRYHGKIDPVGDCYGIQLDIKDDTKGSSTDGSIDGQKYFQCKQGYGLFIKKTRIKSIINTTSSPPINTKTNTNNNNTKNSKKQNTSNTPKKRRNKSPQPNGNHKYQQQLTNNSPPRPRFGARDQIPLTLKK
eukprot:237355_1